MIWNSRRLAYPPTSGSRIWCVPRWPTLSLSLTSCLTFLLAWPQRICRYPFVTLSHHHQTGYLAPQLAGYQHPPASSPSSPPVNLRTASSAAPRTADGGPTLTCWLHNIALPPMHRLSHRRAVLHAWILARLWFSTHFPMAPPHQTSASSSSKCSCAHLPENPAGRQRYSSRCPATTAPHPPQCPSPAFGAAMATNDAALDLCC
jgi:hypothetical protein